VCYNTVCTFLILPFSLGVCANFSMMKAGDLPESHRLGSVNVIETFVYCRLQLEQAE